MSLPSVNRFCKKLGFGGYPALKIQLAQELSSNNRLLVENLQVDKDTPDIVKRVMSDIQATVINVGQNSKATYTNFLPISFQCNRNKIELLFNYIIVDKLIIQFAKVMH